MWDKLVLPAGLEGHGLCRRWSFAEEVKQRARPGGFYSLALLLNPAFSVTSSVPRWASSY